MATLVQPQVSDGLLDQITGQIKIVLALGIIAGLFLPLIKVSAFGFFGDSFTESARVFGGDSSWIGYVVFLIGLIASLIFALIAEAANSRKLGARVLVSSFGWSLAPCLATIWGMDAVGDELPNELANASPAIGMYLVILVSIIATIVGYDAMRKTTDSAGGVVLFSICAILTTWLLWWTLIFMFVWLAFMHKETFVLFAVCGLLLAATWYGAVAGWHQIVAGDRFQSVGNLQQAPTRVSTSARSGVPSMGMSNALRGSQIRHFQLIGTTDIKQQPFAAAATAAQCLAGMVVEAVDPSAWDRGDIWMEVTLPGTVTSGWVKRFSLKPAA